ncbi:MAG: T9SS type A sorting domain-containing protein [candidate division Zixibacteria bacterium]|nr:T9SS type A sorting domain-containing protein [candidate division Zixibacteria bacterium]
MRKRYRFFCFSFLFISMLLAHETKTDIAVPVWGEIIQNHCYLNIEIEGSNVTLHQRIELKVRKLVSDDYLYTFTIKSSNGEFDESSLSIITPPSGVKDSIFDHGCKLQYLSQVALEETLEVAFEYEYQYLNQNIGEILYNRQMGYYWANREMGDTIEFVDITCNQEIEVKERRYPDWRTIGKGTHIVYHPPSLGGFLRLKICLPTHGKTDTLEERTFFELIPEHWEHIPNLIEDEFITIEFTEKNEGLYDYHLYGTIELDVEVATPFAPFYAWFPNDHTNALVKLETIWGSRTEIDVLKVEPSVLGEQKGFYILIPKLSRFSMWGIIRCKEARLIIEIDGVQSESSCDFILVTAPQEYSSVKFKIPEKFPFGYCFSPFEHDITYRDEEFKVRKFYGRCPSTGIAHVEWGTSASPDNVSLFQNYPNPFNQETLIKYTLPWDCAVKLSVYNLLGERVRTLVDEPQNADDYEVRWDGSDDERKKVASGIYFYRVQAREFIQTNKMLLLK